MTAFLYFAPGHTKPVTLDCVRALGLGYAFTESPASSDVSGRTPTGGQGWLFTSAKTVLAHREEKQTWRKIPGSDCWAGYWNDSVPWPGGLAKSEQIDGVPVNLGDGNKWLIPRLRMFAGEDGFQTALPMIADLNDAGEWVAAETTADCESLNKIGDRLYEAMVISLASEDESIRPLITSEALDITCELLAANYHVSKIEVAMLRLLTTDDTLMEAARAAMDWETAMDWAQKKTTEPIQLADAG